jgi:uncharacterized repeat protein (TIGR02543 family)
MRAHSIKKTAKSFFTILLATLILITSSGLHFGSAPNNSANISHAASGLTYTVKTGAPAYCGDGAYVTGYSGASKQVTIPAELDNQPVVSVELVAQKLNALDVSACKNLKALYCSDNTIETLDLKGLNNLKSVYCDNNRLKALTLEGCTNLENISCDKNKLTNLDASPCANLQTLSCSENEISALDVSGLAQLKTLFCPVNKLTDIDISTLTNLSTFFCFNNNIPDGPTLNALIAKFGPNNVLPQASRPTIYTITLDANGGTVTPTTINRADTNESAGTFGTLPTPTRPNHTFDGWWTGGNPATRITANTKVYNTWIENQTADFSVRIYAHWKPDPKSPDTPKPVVTPPRNKTVLKFIAPSKKTIKRGQRVSMKLTNSKNAIIKSISISKKGKKLIKVKKGKTKITINGRNKTGTTKIRITLKTNHKKSIRIKVKA